MTSAHRYSSLQDYLAVIRRHRLIVLVCTLLIAGGALLFTASQDEVYEAESSIEFREPTQDSELINLAPVRTETPEQRAARGAEQANQRDIVDDVRRALGITTPIDEFEKDITAQAEVRTNFVVVQAQSGDPRLAARIADTLATEVVERETEAQRARYNDIIRETRQERRRLRGNDSIAKLERRSLTQTITKLRTVRDVTVPAEVVEPASIPINPIEPRPVRNLVIAIVVGLLLGVMLAFLRAALDRKLRSVREIAEEADLPLLGAIRKQALGKVAFGDPALLEADRDSKGTDAEIDLEAFRIIRTNLDYLAVDVDQARRCVLVTSALPEEGKSTVASSLAVAAGLAGRRVLLVECDLRRPVLATRLGIDRAPGLTDYLVGTAQPGEVVRAVSVGHHLSTNGNGPAESSGPAMAVVCAGSPSPQPAELLGSRRFAEFIAEVSSVYDLVVLDAPPLLSVGDALELVEHTDAVMLCVRANQTTRDQLRSAREALGRLPERPTGLVVTGVTRDADGDYGYYSYAYAYQPTTG